MLESLPELHQNLAALIEEFQEIQNRIVTPLQAKKSNTHSMLIKLPKMMLLVRVAPFLTPQQTNQLAFTCTAIRKAVFSPIGWAVLNKIQTPYPATVRQLPPQQGFEARANVEPLLETINDEKVLKKARQEAKKALMTAFSEFQAKQEQHRVLQNQLRAEKRKTEKTQLYRRFLQQKRQSLQQENGSYRQALKATSEGFGQKIAQLDTANDALIQQNTKLQNQKGALVSKIREYQSEIETIKGDSERSKQVLRRVKNYLLYKQL